MCLLTYAALFASVDALLNWIVLATKPLMLAVSQPSSSVFSPLSVCLSVSLSLSLSLSLYLSIYLSIYLSLRVSFLNRLVTCTFLHDFKKLFLSIFLQFLGISNLAKRQDNPQGF